MSIGIDLALALVLALTARLGAGRSLLGGVLAALALLIVGRFALALTAVSLFPAAVLSAETIAPHCTVVVFALGAAAVLTDVVHHRREQQTPRDGAASQ